MSRVVLAMSGGVDSSVAAHLLRQQGHDVSGVFMRNVPAAASPVDARAGERSAGAAAAEANAEDARRVAETLHFPFCVLDLQAEFEGIIDYFVQEYCSGRTPNPCVACNRRIKFGELLRYADRIGADFVATGHYVRRIGVGADAALYRGVDATKDQSYVLCRVRRQAIPRMLLPNGDFRKDEIRALAARLRLPVAQKRDSQEICFVASGEHDEFVRARRGEGDASGEIVTTEGRVVGRHPGVERFTVGQRKGLGVALGEPYFVVRIEGASRRIVIGKREELARREIAARDVNWLTDEPETPFRCQVQIRYNSPATPAMVRPLPEGGLSIELEKPNYGVAPGQAAVCYDGDRLLGGGWIE